MCEVMEKYTTEARNEGWTKGRAKGKTEAKKQPGFTGLFLHYKLW